MEKQWTVLEALNWTQQRFERSGEENPRLAAQMLAAHATGLSRIELYTQFDKPLTEHERGLLRQAIQRRLEAEPLQYIVGTTGFRHLELKVRPPVLIPRPETELLVGLVLDYAQSQSQSLRILDIGTGTGAIALALLDELPGCILVATDIDEAALELAQENARELKKDDALSLTFYKDNFASSLVAQQESAQSFDVVVSNPPYIPSAEYEALPAEILAYESKLALDGGTSGLDAFNVIAKQALTLLKPAGLFAVELHEDTLDEAAQLARALGYEQVNIHEDLSARPRFLTALKAAQ